MDKPINPGQPKTADVRDLHKLQIESPEFAAAVTSNFLQKSKVAKIERAATLGLPILEQMQGVKQGDLTEIERVLFCQALTLQTAFNQFMQMAALLQENPERCGGYANLALRAQEQCRKTLATLADIKNPKKPTQFIKSYVDKQINQLRVDDRNNVNEKTPLQLEATENAKVDIASTTKASGTNLELETVGEIDGANHGRRKSKSLSK